MKHIPSILFVFIFSLILSGCKQQASLDDPKENAPEKNIPIQNITTGGTLGGIIFLDGLHGPIIISGGKSIFENLFSIDIPKNVTNRMHEKFFTNVPIGQNLSFFNSDQSHVFYITVGSTELLRQSMSNEKICLLQTDYNGSTPFSKTTLHKLIDTHDIYITQIAFHTKGNIHPYDYTYITHFCYVEDTTIYEIVLDNYSFTQANRIIDSFIFLK